VVLAAGGDSPYAVLDKLVPGYYHRRTEQGDICASCCCNNTATEHLMTERLVIDDITHWARTYKVRPLHLLWDLQGFACSHAWTSLYESAACRAAHFSALSPNREERCCASILPSSNAAHTPPRAGSSRG
jgi:hypothetical protein